MKGVSSGNGGVGDDNGGAKLYHTKFSFMCKYFQVQTRLRKSTLSEHQGKFTGIAELGLTTM